MGSTPRVRLLPTTIVLLEAEERGTAVLCRALGVAEPPVWPPAFNDSGYRDWQRALLTRWAGESLFVGNYLVAEGELVGTCGFKGPPDAAGMVEIGYSVIAPRQRRGYASAAARLLVERALADPRVTVVAADTLSDGFASQGVLRRAGFRPVGTRIDEEDGELARFEFRRPG